HGRGPERSVAALRVFVQPGARLLALAADGDSAREVGAALVSWGYGQSVLRAMWDLDAETEGWQEAPASAWASGRVPRPGDLCTLAIECRAEAGAALAPAVPGLADELFEHDGVMTKREVRAATLARLAPMPGQMLWDVGCGCGSVAIEWMRAARGAKAVGLEPRADRRAMAAANAQALGAPGLVLHDARAPEGLAGLPAPDAVFLGGGLSEGSAEAAWWALSPGGRLVANAVTLESEALLVRLASRFGGELARIRVERASPVGKGGPLAWRPGMSVTQWSARK
ncbi:MAG: precorrin-6Y C5,15-methyltransferase (decarboxylating) subunit CbiT, partial [Albimonas sp.]|uniref:precorrin-6Y C5,15-methyltransferase (decarboxylating) subunit CbiT n=1 Tax=Albimonas sp. TaxID=1872425 RepID=UPI0040562B60